MLRQQKKGRQGKKKRERKKGRQKKNHTHVKKVGHTSEFFLLAFIDELWKTLKIRILRKWIKMLEISSFYTCTTIIWDTVPEIQSETVNLGFKHVHHKSRSYDVWFLRHKVQRTKFYIILHLLPFDPPLTEKLTNV